MCNGRGRRREARGAISPGSWGQRWRIVVVHVSRWRVILEGRWWGMRLRLLLLLVLWLLLLLL